MDSQARHELSRAIQREGVGLFENPNRIKALLMDACPESRMEIGLLVQAAEDDIPTRLTRSSESVFRDTEIARAVADLKKTRRLDDGAAQWVVRSWAWALGVLDTEPSDDVGDATSVAPTPSFPPAGQAGSHPYPNAPPSGPSSPGTATSFPPAGSSPQSGPGPDSEPWHMGVMSGGQSAGLGPGRPPWVSQPAFQGPATSSWGGPPPPPAAPGRGRLFAILGTVAAVIVLVVGVALVNDTGSPTPGPPVVSSTEQPVTAGPGQSVAQQAPTDPAQGPINFTITDTLGYFQVAETVEVFSFGQKAGELNISRSQPYDRIAMVGESATVEIELKITMIGIDGGHYTLASTGTIDIYEGVVYAVVLNQDSAGNYIADLQPE